jgi:hypothetical protein
MPTGEDTKVEAAPRRGSCRRAQELRDERPRRRYERAAFLAVKNRDMRRASGAQMALELSQSKRQIRRMAACVHKSRRELNIRWCCRVLLPSALHLFGAVT